jgi:hypothetical protein
MHLKNAYEKFIYKIHFKNAFKMNFLNPFFKGSY